MNGKPKTQKLLQEIRSLKKKIRKLTRELESFKTSTAEDPSSVEKMLKMRGIKVFRKNPTERLFFPPDFSLSYKDRFYEMMKRYSFRLVLRDMVKYQEGFRVRDLTHYCSYKAAQGYCHLLLEMGVIIKDGKGRY